MGCKEALQQEEKEEQLEEISRRLINREEQLFSQDSSSEEEEDQLQRDFEALRLQIWMAVQNTFTSSSSCSSSSSVELEVLRSAVASIQQQEVQDRRWTGCLEGRVPVWRPLKCLSTHNTLLQNLVEPRLMKMAEEDSSGTDGLNSPLKREVSLTLTLSAVTSLHNNPLNLHFLFNDTPLSGDHLTISLWKLSDLDSQMSHL